MTWICNSLGVIFLLGAMSLPFTIVFPLNAFIALLGGIFLTSLIYGEKLNRMKTIGALLGLTGNDYGHFSRKIDGYFKLNLRTKISRSISEQRNMNFI
jgi:hypothetical protein